MAAGCHATTRPCTVVAARALTRSLGRVPLPSPCTTTPPPPLSRSPRDLHRRASSPAPDTPPRLRQAAAPTAAVAETRPRDTIKMAPRALRRGATHTCPAWPGGASLASRGARLASSQPSARAPATPSLAQAQPKRELGPQVGLLRECSLSARRVATATTPPPVPPTPLSSLSGSDRRQLDFAAVTAAGRPVAVSSQALLTTRPHSHHRCG